MQTFHIRFTPSPTGLPSLNDYSFDFLDKFEKFVYAREDKDKKGNPVPVHYHIYIETSYGDATVRQKAKEALRLPAGGRGKNNGYYSLIPKWTDVGYICKYNDIQASKAYTEKELMDFVISGKNKYLLKMEKTPAENSVTAGSSTEPRIEPRTSPRKVSESYVKKAIAIATAEWYKYKRTDEYNQNVSNKRELVKIVIKAIRECGRGINPYQVRDFCLAVLSDDPDYLDDVVGQIYSMLKI